MNIVWHEVAPFLLGSLLIFTLLGLAFRGVRMRRASLLCYLLAVIFSLYLIFFFRDPPRTPPEDPAAVLAGADGTVMTVKDVQEDMYLKTEAVRISIFLSLLDVHVNRAPIAGTVEFADYFPGTRYFTFQEKSSEFNQHSAIMIRGERTRCLVKQIVGPVARRVVYWLNTGDNLNAGQRIGMMKFGSRLDIYLPKSDVSVTVREGDRVRAGETIVARITRVLP